MTTPRKYAKFWWSSWRVTRANCLTVMQISPQKMAQNTRPPSCIFLHLIATKGGCRKLRHRCITFTFVSQWNISTIFLLWNKDWCLKPSLKWVEIDLKCYKASCTTKTAEEEPSTTTSTTIHATAMSVKSQGNSSIVEWCPLQDINSLVCRIEKDWGKIFIVEKEVWGDRHNTSIFWRPGKDYLLEEGLGTG